MCFSPYLGVFFVVVAGGPKEAGAQPAYAIFQQISETDFFFYILTTHNHQISHVNYVLHPLYVFFGLFGCLDGGMGARAQPAYAIFHSQQIKSGNFQN